MGMKIVLIGGGSYTWTPTLAGDLFLRPALAGSHLSLVDVVPEAAERMREYCDRMNQAASANWTVSAQSLDDALRGADVVCVSISTGGLAAMHEDYHIPEKYGVYHTVGDTVGPGGISRTLRNVPVFLDIAQRMERLCPRAWMIHVTNPLSQLTRAVAQMTSIRVVGLCHNFAGTMATLAHYFGVEYEQVDAVSVGVNHYTWLKDLTVKGEAPTKPLSLDGYTAYHRAKKEALLTQTTDDMIKEHLEIKENMEFYLNFALYERLGYFPVGSSNHVAENLSYYCNDEAVLARYHIRRKGVLPRRQKLMDVTREQVEAVLKGTRELPEAKLSREGLSEICEAMYSGQATRTMVTLPNVGQISNLPHGTAVETWATIASGGITPVISGDIPEVVLGSVQTIVAEQEASVRAAITGDRQELYRALHVSPMLQDKDVVEPLAEELLAANRQYLPQFFK